MPRVEAAADIVYRILKGARNADAEVVVPLSVVPPDARCQAKHS